MIGCSQISWVRKHPTHDNPKKKSLETEGGEREDSKTKLPLDIHLQKKNKEEKKNIKASALKRKTGIAAEEDVGCQQLDIW